MDVTHVHLVFIKGLRMAPLEHQKACSSPKAEVDPSSTIACDWPDWPEGKLTNYMRAVPDIPEPTMLHMVKCFLSVKKDIADILNLVHGIHFPGLFP